MNPNPEKRLTRFAARNGKGSARRGDAEAQRRYAEGWDRIFGAKQEEPPSIKAKRLRRRPRPQE